MIKLIVGLGNPGQKYEDTRHNAGVWMLNSIAKEYGASLHSETKFSGLVGRFKYASQDIRLLFPTTFMNLSGQAVIALSDYFKIQSEEILVLHDELDLEPGTVRLKKGGGHGGHNGLRNIIQHLDNQFYRLRIGIGHPGDRNQVTNFVLKMPSDKERLAIEKGIDIGLKHLPEIIKGNMQKVMNQLNQKPKKPKQAIQPLQSETNPEASRSTVLSEETNTAKTINTIGKAENQGLNTD